MRDFESENSGNYSIETLDTAQSDRAATAYVIDLRKSPRVDTRFPATMISENGSVDGLVTNLSRSGLRFECDQATETQLLANVRQQVDEQPVVVEFSFSVPGEDSMPVEVIVQARIVYVLHEDGGNYQCGVELRRFAAGEDTLMAYLHTRRA